MLQELIHVYDIFGRTVALEMANEEEEELLGVIKDVKGFLKRSDGIPSYVSKEQLFSALTRIMKKPSVQLEKKVEAVDLSGKFTFKVFIFTRSVFNHCKRPF